MVLRLALCAIVALATGGPVTAAVPLRGDRELLDFVLAAQETNLTLFPKGKLRAVVHTERGLPPPHEVNDLSTRMIWDGDKTFWDCTYTQTSPRESNAKKQGDLRLIEIGTTDYYYDARVKLAQRVTGRDRAHLFGLQLRPDQLWFSFERIDLWTHYLRPDDPRWTGKPLSHFEVREGETDRIVVELHNEQGGGLRVEASPREGGNIIGYESFGDVPMWFKGSYDWAALPDGRWYLKAAQFERWLEGDPEHPERRSSLTEVEIVEFDPEPDIPPDQFHFSALRVDPGALVQEIGPEGMTQKSYRFGGDQDGLDQDVLDELSDKLRREGFASPDRP